MNAKMEKIETNVVKFEVTVEAEKFNGAVKKAFAKNARKFNVPGFRKGKAPMGIVKQYYGENVLYEDAIEICCNDTYPQVIDENNIIPVDYPEIDIVQIGEGKEFIYTATVVVRPEVRLGYYKDLEVKKVEYKVSDEEVENQLKAMQEKNARVETKSEGASVEKGNIAVIDFKGFIDGVAFEGGEGKDYPLEIGSGSFIGNFEDQLVGLKVGENKDIVVKFPDDYGTEKLNGKEAKFEVAIKEIKVKELPALDDEFATEASEFDTIAELKADTRKKLEEGNANRTKTEYEEAVIEAVCENTKVEIPDVMIEKEIDVMLKELEYRLRYQGLDLESYYKYTNNTEEKVREFMRETAQKKVKTELALEAIAKQENIEVTDEEVKERAKQMAGQYGEKDIEKNTDRIVSTQGKYIKEDLEKEKTVDLLVNSSKPVVEETK